MNRRTFVIAGATSLLSVYADAAPSDRINVGVIGSGSRGTFVMTVFQKDPAVRIGAICDVYETNLERALTTARKVPGNDPKSYRDHRDLLADKHIDAVLIATPEHWHHRHVLDALAAGKDVYIEKPLCQTPEQGVELVAAEKRSKNIVQVGMQRRSYDLYHEARKVVAAGTLGNVRMVRSWWLNNYLNQPSEAKLEGHLDWERWQGPARHVPFDPYRFRNWRYFSDYASGIVGDQGAHVFDGIQMLMGAGSPKSVTAGAGKPHKERVDMPESVAVVAEYSEDFIGVFSVNYGAMKYKQRNDQLNQLDGDLARMDIGREEFKVFAQGSEDTAQLTKASESGFGKATDLHVQNFLQSIRARQAPTAPMALGFQAALVILMGNLSLKHGRRVRWNAQSQKVEM